MSTRFSKAVVGCPGANDNATGVAAVLELAQRFSGRRQPRTIRFVAFVNEEPPFFRTEHMGSAVYANALRSGDERVVGMLSLETMGYYSEERGSQRYPAPMATVYPDVGNFIGFVANVASARLLWRLQAAHLVSTAVRHRSRRDPGCGLVRPLGVLAGRVPGDDGHRHGPVPLPVVPHGRRHAGEG